METSIAELLYPGYGYEHAAQALSARLRGQYYYFWSYPGKYYDFSTKMLRFKKGGKVSISGSIIWQNYAE
jgi:hypothetical protein